MGWISGIVVFLTIWWTVLFAVLPWGIRPHNTADSTHAAGLVAPGAPIKTGLKQKFLITTVISCFLWAGVYGLIRANIIDFYSQAAQMEQQDNARAPSSPHR